MGIARYDFEDETVVVTGGSSGIGRAVARRFGDAGATVIVADVREEPKGDETAPTHELIEDAGGRAAFVETDVADPDAVESVVAAAREFGGVDVMVNNAGVFRGAPVVDADPDVFDDLFGINVRGMLVGMQAAARDMLDRDDPGAIVNTASISSECAQSHHAMYDATKGAVMMLTRVAGLELAQSDVRVNAVAPGPVATEIGSGDDVPSGGRGEYSMDVVETRKRAPMDRRADPAEVAGAYLFLASDDASFVTGHLLYVDGGYRIV